MSLIRQLILRELEAGAEFWDGPDKVKVVLLPRDEHALDGLYDRAQLAAETHLTLCVDALHDGSDDSPTIRPFCGCDTCIVREVLFAAKEELLAIVRAEA